MHRCEISGPTGVNVNVPDTQLNKNVFSLNHVRLNVVQLFFEVQITFDVGGQVSNVKTSRYFMGVDGPPEMDSLLHNHEHT